jgi:Bacterial aa3 type cytochrome c oxidase subunit IV
MDYAEHERTYDAFVRFATIGTIWCLAIVVGLAIGTTGKSWAWGGLMITLASIAGMVGIFVKSVDHKAVTGVFALSLLIWLLKAI